MYNKKLEENITIEQFKKQYKDLKLKESAIKEQIEQLKKESKNMITDKEIFEIIEEFKCAENFNNEIMKKLINKIEVFEDKTVNIIFNF